MRATAGVLKHPPARMKDGENEMLSAYEADSQKDTLKEMRRFVNNILSFTPSSASLRRPFTGTGCVERKKHYLEVRKALTRVKNPSNAFLKTK